MQAGTKISDFRYSNMWQDELESDDDKTDTMSVMSVATAVLDKRELEQPRHARPAIQYYILCYIYTT